MAYFDGHHVVHINAGTSTIERLQQMQSDLLMLSWSWPGGSALQVCRDVRLWGNVPIVAPGTDVEVEVETSIAALEAGADIFLAPPFKTRELVARVRAIARCHPGLLKMDVGESCPYPDEFAFGCPGVEEPLNL